MPRALALAPLALALALSAPLAGCLACEPHLDVRHCEQGSPSCAPVGRDRVLAWNDDLNATFPDVARLLAKVPEGDHGHAEWSEEQEDGFWAFWDVPASEPHKEVFFHQDGPNAGLFRVRVLSCD